MPEALKWYDYCLKRRPSDGTAKGATMTIRERYLPAWRLMEQGRYDEATEAIDEYLTVAPTSTLALHVKAHILEQKGDLVRARETWRLAAEGSALNHHARYKVAELSERLGLPVPEHPTYLQAAAAGDGDPATWIRRLRTGLHRGPMQEHYTRGGVRSTAVRRVRSQPSCSALPAA